jgi:hypothetical protein
MSKTNGNKSDTKILLNWIGFHKAAETLSEALIMPGTAEDKNEFISRFMSDELSKKEFPENKQRLAVAYSQWERSKKGLKEDLDPEAMDNPEDEEQVKDFDQKETGATEEKEEQLADKTEDIIVATEKE